MVEAISHLIHRDYEAIVEDFVTLQFIDPGTNLRPILPVLAKVSMLCAPHPCKTDLSSSSALHACDDLLYCCMVSYTWVLVGRHVETPV